MSSIEFTIIGTCIGMITGIAGLVISLVNTRKGRLDLIKEVFFEFNSEHHKSIRKYIYNFRGDAKAKISDEKYCNYASIEISLLDFWGFVTMNGYSPKKFFKGGHGMDILKIYDELKPYISYRRNNGKPYFAEHFISLCNYIEKHDSV